MPSRPRWIVGIAILTAGLLASPAYARTATVGSLAAPGGDFTPAHIQCASALQLATAPESPSYVVPFDGTLKTWSFQNADVFFDGTPASTATAWAQVYRPLGPEKWLVVGQSEPGNIARGELGTFSTRIPVRAGDILGLRATDSCAYTSGVSADEVLTFGYHATPGTTATPDGPGFNASRLNVRATIDSCAAKESRRGRRERCGERRDSGAGGQRAGGSRRQG